MTDELLQERLAGLDEALEQELERWNAAGLAVGILVGDELRYAKAVGYRDFGEKLPLTTNTLIPIASNTKLMTAVACGMLVEEGKLTWDQPVKRSVSQIEFFNDHLNSNVSLRDMLAHRTGITRHDQIWYKTSFTRRELFERIRSLEPQAPLRTQYIYNNLMYAAAGYIVELLTGQTWEEFVTSRIFKPLGMERSCLSVPESRKDSDHAIPYGEHRDSFELQRLPDDEQIVGAAPAGAAITSIEEIANWMATVLNKGKFKGEQLIPASIFEATLHPALATPNTLAETKGFWENLNMFAGMGRTIHVYRGNLLAMHGGYLPAFHTQVSFLPKENIGLAAFVIGDHAGSLANILTYNICERLLGLNQTPWSDRLIPDRLAAKEALKKRREGAAAASESKGSPAHPLEDYVGDFEDEMYGIVRITLDTTLRFQFGLFQAPLTHVHYERFDTPDDEHFGKYSLNFFTNSGGDSDRLFTNLDGAEVAFVRKPATVPEETLRKLAGQYKLPDNNTIEVIYRATGEFVITRLQQAEMKLVPYKELTFLFKDSPSLSFRFMLENDEPAAMEMIDPSGTLSFPKVTS